jgi:hypothetical protein
MHANARNAQKCNIYSSTQAARATERLRALLVEALAYGVSLRVHSLDLRRSDQSAARSCDGSRVVGVRHGSVLPQFQCSCGRSRHRRARSRRRCGRSERRPRQNLPAELRSIIGGKESAQCGLMHSLNAARHSPRNNGSAFRGGTAGAPAWVCVGRHHCKRGRGARGWDN